MYYWLGNILTYTIIFYIHCDIFKCNDFGKNEFIILYYYNI